MMELKRIAGVGMLMGMVWLGTGTSVRSQEVSIEAATMEEELLQVEALADSTVPERVVRERLAKLQNEIPLRYHKVTHQFVEYFIYKKPDFVRRMLEQMNLFFPLYEQTLEKYGMPRELKFLSLIESGLNPRIISYAGAGGLWQFMPATGREYGMHQDDYIDERFDPVKSTDAACRYLKRLYNAFGDWEMALAAYNVGPGNVKRAMRRSGSSTFWGIYNFLPKQTRHYVPQFVAITYMMHYHADHGIFPETPEFPTVSDTVHISGYFNLHTFAKLGGITLEELYKLNPKLVNTELPVHTKNCVVRLPLHCFHYLAENRQMIWDSASKSSVTPVPALASTAGELSGSEEGTAETDEGTDLKKVYHTVRSGETLAKIAKRYRVSAVELKKWNSLHSNSIQRGKRLVVYRESPAPDRLAAAPAKTKANAKIKIRYHRVQSGDTLSTIAERYGIDVSRLKKINRLRGNMVRKGQKLLVG
ncbi:lytic transglycosylase domain-containing protein [Runella slithyformis]|uniref:Lytic transglycosylase catalytic n=1 Tax=Runella slithyformis (strain ATCC 29530 / DSM 19594 / LMG 11500 / NCIMB 11436 / LSU 4) TaxID=761193 RepID=A0A7U3ZLH6_RUNSL|nr:lytic transglycosylase domain-containing protein [Runella slithyformis]AEI49405.1 Lytic transglycosylase catalytic [Runella slithyformis DSM 19594]